MVGSELWIALALATSLFLVFRVFVVVHLPFALANVVSSFTVRSLHTNVPQSGTRRTPGKT